MSLVTTVFVSLYNSSYINLFLVIAIFNTTTLCISNKYYINRKFKILMMIILIYHTCEEHLSVTAIV